MNEAGVWAKLSSGRAVNRPPNRRLMVGLAALFLVGMVYLIWNPVSGDAAHLTATPVPTAESGGEYFLRAYEDTTEGAQPATDGWAVAADMAIKLALVVGLIYLTGWGLRALLGRARLPLTCTGSIGVLESANLAPNKSLYLVEVGSKVLLLGGTQTQLAVLTEFADPAVVRSLRGEKGFSQHLEAETSRLENQEAAPAEPATAEGQDLIRDCVRELRQISQRFGRKE